MFFSKKKEIPAAKEAELKRAPAPISDALILICEKCGKKLSSDPDSNPAHDLHAEMRQTIKSRYEKGKTRSVLTSCLDICPKGEIAVAISGSRDRFFTAEEPLDERALRETANALINLALRQETDS